MIAEVEVRQTPLTRIHGVAVQRSFGCECEILVARTLQAFVQSLRLNWRRTQCSSDLQFSRTYAQAGILCIYGDTWLVQMHAPLFCNLHCAAFPAAYFFYWMLAFFPVPCIYVSGAFFGLKLACFGTRLKCSPIFEKIWTFPYHSSQGLPFKSTVSLQREWGPSAVCWWRIGVVIS